ncbi:hypothetical protein FHS72_003307 [Loktanella ponticola]|uniref:Uncharacterized protein n=1 Tax=Yoonia ponticola TaxID=1524255 RepID=A0A7W9BNK8_9RHOB|nr:hypothetical protein [Yoonia ponticola]MBB5723662.1 hypothetical protein [Yoonia ponticola]
MKHANFALDVAAFAADLEVSFTSLCEVATPVPETWVGLLTDWFTQCRAAPDEAFSEDVLCDVLETLVSLMHARSTFALCAMPRPGRRPEALVSGDLGGVVMIELACKRIIMLARQRDRDMAYRLASVVLRQVRSQRSAVAEMIYKAI